MTTEKMTTAKITFEQQLEKLRVEYLQQLPQKLLDVHKDWNQLKNEWSAEQIVLLHRNVHSLIGTSGTFGFKALSNSARELEIILKPFIETDTADEENQFQCDELFIDTINVKIEQLFSLLRDIQSNQTLHEKDKHPEKLGEQISTLNDSEAIVTHAIIYYLNHDHNAPSQLTQQLASYGFKVSHWHNLQDFLTAVENEKPGLALLDLTLPDTSAAEIFSTAQRLAVIGVKVIVLSGNDDFGSRLASVRAGAHAYLSKPTDVPALVGQIRNALHINTTRPSHVLIVDDQDSVVQFYSSVLNHAGINTTATTNPFNTLALMREHTPDILLLDLNMPDISGKELAAVIRQHEQYQSIPIIFLSAEVNADLKTSLLEIGSDDLLLKGMPHEELVRQVKSRLARAKILRAMMYEDSLTGLLNHAQIQLAAERVFSLCKRRKTPCCIAMIDIDFFKKVNDSYGHLTGDRVIKALANLLEQRFRLTDYIGRFGGEEFMLALPDVTVNDAANLINNLRKAFSAIEFKEGNTVFTVSFSAGVADNANASNVIDQVRSADEALYRAKARGRNMICANLKG